jgi:hypothetical protein
MSCQTLPIPSADPTLRVIPRRPVARLGAAQLAAARRAAGESDAVSNLFSDVYSGVIDAPSSPAARARDRARRMVEEALDRAETRVLPQLTNLWQADAALQAPALQAANDAVASPDLQDRALRHALCAQPEGAPDAPATVAERDRLRLAVHALNTTLTIAYPPVGAVVMTYSFLRGESMRLTTRSLVLMGAVMAFMHGQIPGV